MPAGRRGASGLTRATRDIAIPARAEKLMPGALPVKITKRSPSKGGSMRKGSR